MSSEISALENWLDCIYQETDNHAYEYIWEAYKLLAAMGEPETVFTMFWTYEKLQPVGIRLKSEFRNTLTIEINSIDQQNLYLEYFQTHYCDNLGFKTMADWVVSCARIL